MPKPFRLRTTFRRAPRAGRPDSGRRKRFARIAVLFAAATVCSSGCDRPSDLPSTQIFMLIDVSKTWHNARDDDRNRRVLGEAGMAAAMAADQLASNSGSPIAVQSRVIGSLSLEREPACDVVYLKQLIQTGTDKAYQLSSLKELRQYLGKDCPEKVLAIPPEDQTEISNALISLADQLPVKASDRKIVIMSDFLEEAVRPVSPVDLTGFSILMLYRPLREDQTDPAAMHARIARWKALFTTLGATVLEVPDTGIKREVIADFLKRPPPAAKGAPQ